MSRPLLALIILLPLSSLLLNIVILTKLLPTKKLVKNPSLVQTSPQPTPPPSPVPAYAEHLRVKGILKTEPDNRDLGSKIMTVFYFDEPYLLIYNSSGSPQFINSIEAGIKAGFMPGKNLTGKHLEVYGTLDWGYAESQVLNIEAAREIK